MSGCSNDNYSKKYNLNFIKKGIMAHACGSIDGHEYTNSKEAIDLSISEGRYLIEIDFSLTSDNKIVANHKWNKDSYDRLGINYPGENTPLSYNEFMSSSIYGKYTPIDLDGVISYMKKYPDLYILIDITKDLDIKTTKKMYSIIADKLVENGLVNRVVVQAGTIDMFNTIDEIYNFPYKHFYVMEDDYKNGKLDEILSYMDSKEGFISVGAHKDYTDKHFIKEAHKHGYYVAIFPINTKDEAKKFFDMGVDNICTDVLSYNDIKEYIK